ncbi:MAG TPA: beta-ketoacyl-[acyl-carrier-protein] synthase family protein [Candidatus Omnitrophota bacterium]|nr:beta-ketoacyl-[acyl-carrier-protein] synthase family protein [Candidatus Omnitrophota bacterium]
MKRVVITGIGVMSPNGIGKQAFKNAVIQGKSGISRISQFDPEGLECQIAGQIHLNGDFFSKKELKNLPRTAQLAILASTEAFQDAKIDHASLSDDEKKKFGVILGTGGGSVEFMEKHYEMYYGEKDLLPSLYVISASTPGGLSSELSIRFGLRGRSHVVTTGCTSSSDALGYAFQTIQMGKLDRVLTGGSDAPIAEGIMQGFCLMKVIATKWNSEPEKGSRPFNKDREGFVLGEGSWMFILEEMEHAKKRGAKIYAEILGYGSSCEAFHAVRLEEDGNANFHALELALSEAGIPKEAIEYINLHGTSTQLNDKVETNVLKRFFGNHAYKIPMSAVKSMIGHPQGASGSAGLAATLLSMEEKMLHPTINLDSPDPECDLDYIPNTARKKEVEHVLCNTLGFGSKCSVLILKNMLNGK